MTPRTRTPRPAAPASAPAEPSPAPAVPAPNPIETSSAPEAAPAEPKVPRSSRKDQDPSKAKAPRARKASPAPAPVAPATVAPAGKMYGYARVSTTDQDLSIQEIALKLAGCEVIRAEKRSGTSIASRVELTTLLEFLRSGDTLVVTRIDRLARSIADLTAIVRDLESRGVALRATEQPVDTGSAAGKAFLGMLGVFAEFEANIRRERQLEGIAKAKAEGVYKGRPVTIDPAKVRELYAAGVGPTEIAQRLGIGRASVYRLLSEPAA